MYDFFFTCAHIQMFFRSSKFGKGSQVRQTPEEGRRTYRPKRCGNNNKDEDNNPKTLNDKNHQALSQKFKQRIMTSCMQRVGETTSVAEVKGRK